MTKNNQQRLYGVTTFYEVLEDVIANFGDMLTSMKSNLISKAFRERIMLAVTEVNGCPLCSYGHTAAALKAGMSEQEVEALLNGELGDAPADELVALLFAQHYAETVANPEHDAWQQVVSTYGAAKAKAILAAIRAIMVGNLYGNMIDALHSRLKGKAIPNSTLWQELGILLGMPVYVLVISIQQLFARIFGRKKVYAWETYEVQLV